MRTQRACRCANATSASCSSGPPLFRHLSVTENIALTDCACGRGGCARRTPISAAASPISSTSCSSRAWASAFRPSSRAANGSAWPWHALWLSNPVSSASARRAVLVPLDAQVRRDLRRWLREAHDRTGHTTLFVTHDQEEALELADRVAILNRGLIEQIGTPDEVLDRPATPFVAGFVGDAVRLPVGTAGNWIRLGTPRRAHGAIPRQRLLAELFVRPRDLRLAPPLARCHSRESCRSAPHRPRPPRRALARRRPALCRDRATARPRRGQG